MDDRVVADLLAHQDQVISRGQVLEAGGNDNEIARRLRRREWAQHLPGVYAAHTGPLSRDQHEWVAILYYTPAALTGPSALRRFGVRVGRDLERPDGQGTVHLAVALDRRVAERPGITLSRIKRFHKDVQENLSPPRVRLEQAVLDVVATTRTERAAVAVLCDAVQSRRTTPERLLLALDKRPKLRHRALARRILRDVSAGACSVLEQEYLSRVERKHGLPAGTRQRRVVAGRSPTYRDVEYLHVNTVVELDGRLGHDRALDRWDDLERDLDSATAGSITLRLGWGQVLDACRAAAGVARVLLARGWEGRPRACSATCPVASISGAQPAPGAGQPPRIDR